MPTPKPPNGAVPSLPERLFDREAGDHAWVSALGELDEHADVGRRAVAKNWRMDGRVAADREAGLLAVPDFAGLSSASDGEDWWTARQKAFESRLCRPPEHSDALAAPNANNRIAPDALAPHQHLVHVASLQAVLWRLTAEDDRELSFRWFLLTGRPFELPVGDSRDWSTFVPRVNSIWQTIEAQGKEVQQELAGLLCERLGRTEPLWWACLAHEVRPFLEEEDAIGLARALGLGHLRAGERLIVWRYEVSDLRRAFGPSALVRPTAIEANDNPYHFPGSVADPLGITMPLSKRGGCRELLHPPLRGQLAIDACLPPALLLESDTLPDWQQRLPTLRKRHRKRLAWESTALAAWLDRHPSIADAAGGS